MVDWVDGPISLSAYAAHRGCSKQAVSQAIQSQRLLRSIVRVKGQPKIADVALADHEWQSNTGRPTRQKSESSTAPPADTADVTIQESIHPGQVISASTLIEAQRIATLERARKLRLENDVAEGRLVSVDRVAKESFEAERIIRESVLNLPARIGGELHAERDPGRFVIKFDFALREALNLAADALEAIAHG